MDSYFLTLLPVKPCKTLCQHQGQRWRAACNQSKSRSLVTGELSMRNQKTRKCAHIPCLCDVRDGQEYCGDACRDAGGEDVEIACQCDHLACPLTFRQFADLAS